MRVAVLGGRGFIGTAICRRLLASGHSVSIFSRAGVQSDSNFSDHPQVRWVNGDPFCAADLRRVVQGCEAAIYLHSTTVPKSSKDDPAFDLQSNGLAALTFLGVVAEHEMGRCIFISSGGTVYGPPQYLPIDEAHPTNPGVSYGITKLAIEHHFKLLSQTSATKPLIFRVSNPYGAFQRLDSGQGVVSHFLSRALKGDQVQIYGDGQNVRDYLYMDDLAEAFERALFYEGNEVVMNIGSGVGTSLVQLLDTIEKVTDCRIERQYLPARDFDVSVNILSNERAKSALGWSPKTDLARGLDLTARALKIRS